MAIEAPEKKALQVSDLAKQGIRFVRIQYPDLHGVSRGKVIPARELERIVHEGLPFVAAIMTVDLRHNVVGGFETGFEDLLAKPDVSTLVCVPWEPEVAWCLADLFEIETGRPYPVDSRAALRRVVERYSELGLDPIVGPELEFYLCEADASRPCGYQRYMNKDSHVYTVGSVADRLGILEQMLNSCLALGLGAYAANQEFGRGQYEINLQHSSALDSADRAFRFKTLVKELANRSALLATFIGKPWNDDEGSGFHLHVSLASASSSNAFLDPAAAGGLSDLARHFTAGVLEHAPALMGVLNPTVNAYRRLKPDALVPTRINWGHDNRFTLVRVPKERGASTRAEIRMADGAANPYLAYAATLVAGLDGVQRRLAPPVPLEGLIYELPEERQGAELPRSLEAALEALQADQTIKAGLGEEIVDTFAVIKKAELARYRYWVTDWEFAEYAQLL